MVSSARIPRTEDGAAGREFYGCPLISGGESNESVGNDCRFDELAQPDYLESRMDVGTREIVAVSFCFVDQPPFQCGRNADHQFDTVFSSERLPFIAQRRFILRGNDVHVRQVDGVVVEENPVQLVVSSNNRSGEIEG